MTQLTFFSMWLVATGLAFTVWLIVNCVIDRIEKRFRPIPVRSPDDSRTNPPRSV